MRGATSITTAARVFLGVGRCSQDQQRHSNDRPAGRFFMPVATAFIVDHCKLVLN